MSIEIPVGLLKCANIAAQQAYRVVEADPKANCAPNTAHRLAYCGWISSLMVRQLTAMGYEADQDIRRGHNLGGNTNEHAYLIAEPNSLGVVIDATWQQFMPLGSLTPELPKVLIGERDDVVEQVIRYGVDEVLVHLWQERRLKRLDDFTNNTN